MRKVGRYQLRTPANRHLVDIDDIRVVDPVELIAIKVISMSARRHTPKGQADRADLMRLLIAFPALKTIDNAVAKSLKRFSAT